MNRALLEKPFEPSQIKQRQGNFGHILDYVPADTGQVLYDGVLACKGNPREIFQCIGQSGYEECVKCST